ncbi:DNA repair protein XRCC3 [Lates japonicus]|uniref:DNA repair protein XRCC3 n=1 Tax=Lates japonicus TaxID=270547 RepID=A0AAD3NHD4_LATJO|nr:DNA repair protein XRCC3 [Lates japonicus]
MNWDQLELNPRIAAAARRALKSVREVLCVSGPDLQRLTGLSRSDVQQLLAAAAAACRRHPPVPALLLHRGQCRRFESGLRLSVGCPVLDRLLRGGLPVGGVTELAGESGAGKTQLALQLCLPSQGEQSSLHSDVPPTLINRLQFSDHVYIEHAADLDSLQVCLSQRVPLLLARGLVRLLVVDSVAALFRSEFLADNWLERNKQLLTFSSALHHLSQEFTTPVLCINQVTDVFNSSDDSLGPPSSGLSPALGLAWANQVMVRLMMRRLRGTITRGNQSSSLRRLEVVFAPHLARDGRDAAVWREGVRGVDR